MPIGDLPEIIGTLSQLGGIPEIIEIVHRKNAGKKYHPHNQGNSDNKHHKLKIVEPAEYM